MDSAHDVAERFALRLSEDLTEWLDDKTVREQRSSTLFNQPYDAGEHVWGGQMLPDTLPLLGNGAGDTLSLRFASDGTVRDVIAWDHETGRWSPYGATLADALLTDAALHQGDLPLTTCPEPSALFYARWALKHSAPSLALDDWLAAESRFGALIAHGVDTPALREYRCRKSLETGQDWDTAADEANAVVRIRRDLGWPFDVLGCVAEQRGDIDTAMRYYLHGIVTLFSSGGFTYYWPPPSGKRELSFAVGRLAVLRPDLPGKIPYLRVALARDVRSYWWERAEQAEEEGEYGAAYRHYYRAGWDEYYTNDMPEILARLARTADGAGWEPLKRLAAHHLQHCHA